MSLVPDVLNFQAELYKMNIYMGSLRLMLTLIVVVTCLVVWLCAYLHSLLEDLFLLDT